MGKLGKILRFKMDIITGNSSHSNPVWLHWNYLSFFVPAAEQTTSLFLAARTGNSKSAVKHFPFSRVRAWIVVQTQRKPSFFPPLSP